MFNLHFVSIAAKLKRKFSAKQNRFSRTRSTEAESSPLTVHLGGHHSDNTAERRKVTAYDVEVRFESKTIDP
jgi:hypothetical protein